MTLIWLSPETLNWRVSCYGWRSQPENSWSRAHVLWEHADRTIANATSDLALVDGVTALKRTLNHRIKHLINIFDLRSIRLIQKPHGSLELLAYLGVIRPVLLDRLLAIRNGIEHEDSPPPAKAECQELSEFAWYFLRATDYASRATPTAVALVEPGEEDDYQTFEGWGRGLEIITGADSKWSISVNGTLPKQYVAMTEQKGWIALEPGTCGPRNEDPGFDIDSSMPPDDVMFRNAVFRGTPAEAEAIYRLYFKVI